MRRRTFLSTSAIAELSLRGAPAATVVAGDIPKRVLGKTGEETPRYHRPSRRPLSPVQL